MMSGLMAGMVLLWAVTTDEIVRAVRDLGAADFKTREAAATLLWSAEKAAEPVLEEATRSADPEVALRARQILGNIRSGIRPDTPADIRALIQQFVNGDLAAKQKSVTALLAMGDRGYPALTALAAAEVNPDQRLRLFRAPFQQATERLVNLDEQHVVAALPAIRLCITVLPQDSSILQKILPLLDQTGHKAEAEELFTQAYAAMAELCQKYSDSAEAHNNLAWLCAVARRRLDDGFTHAQRATKLVPDSAPYLDTLAEIHFQRGDRAKAIELANACIKHAPDMEYFRAQLDRFTSGDPSTPPPEPQ